jgi:hypothetical protein
VRSEKGTTERGNKGRGEWKMEERKNGNGGDKGLIQI